MSDSQHALITGGMSFVGSHLAETRLAAGQRVTMLEDLSTGRTENLAHLSGHERLRGFGDTRVRVPDTSRLGDLTGWQPSRDLDRIIQDAGDRVRQEAGAL
jgi:nucleoside-diphosphate-sugar epimerase